MTHLKDYKGYYLEVDANGDFTAHEYTDRKQECHDSNDVASAKTLEALEKQLDQISKAKLTQPCFIILSEYEKPIRLMQATITSIKSSDSYGVRIRVTFKDGKSTRREELDPEEIYKVTPQNQETVNKIIQVENDIQKLTKDKEKLEKNLESFKKEDFIQ